MGIRPSGLDRIPTSRSQSALLPVESYDYMYSEISVHGSRYKAVIGQKKSWRS
ncbi:hypothetical protein BCh11DRAFT_04436 [Burkholderia sp. Ch1-1]|nr:hypothetical protein BCh11DRAFT_04436 [Burkholderia sp. Ch1-1]